MQKILYAEEMREVDRLTTERYAIPSLLLMETAAASVCSAISTRLGSFAGKEIAVVCGPGNNGGDGAAVARQLFLNGASVHVFLVGSFDRTKGDARVNFEVVSRLAREGSRNAVAGGRLVFSEIGSDESAIADMSSQIEQCAVIIDALFGTGLTRALSGTPLGVVQLINKLRDDETRERPLIVSVDIPSGLNADIEYPLGEAIHADLTVTFTSPKPANVLPPAADYCGELIISDIGTPAALIDAQPSRIFLAERGDALAALRRTRHVPGSYKNIHGHVLVIAGSRGMSGAPVLSSNAAMRSGAGLVTLATPESAFAPAVTRLMPEVIAGPLAETPSGSIAYESHETLIGLIEKSTVSVIGPGITTDDETRRLVRTLVSERTIPFVIDADGLNCLSPWPEELSGSADRPIIVTPHPGELKRLLGSRCTEGESRVKTISEFAVDRQLIVVAKGTRTMVAGPDGTVVLIPTGNPGVGTAGAGDTLTGIIGGLLAQDFGTNRDTAKPVETAVAAVYLAGMAADITAKRYGKRAMTASMISEHLSEAFVSVDPEGEAP